MTNMGILIKNGAKSLKYCSMNNRN